MILLSVGKQLGFDRLVMAMDAIAPQLGHDVIAQTGAGTFSPRNMQAQAHFSAEEFEQLVAAADLIVAHAGIGSVLSARRHGRPIVLMPRRAELREHRNDHQLATAHQLRGRSQIFIADRESDLPGQIAAALASTQTTRPETPAALAQLQAAIARFIAGD